MTRCNAAPMALWLVIAAIVLFTQSTAAAQRREVITSQHGAVATDDGRCSRAGRDVLREGGHAVDAAVAAALCLGVVSPASSGIGGGAFMLVRPASGEAQAYDMRETAPLKASKDMYGGNAGLKEKGALSIAVPGEIAGLHEAWKQYGKLPWNRLVKPAAHFARSGFRISPYLHMQMSTTQADIFSDEGLRSMFTSNGSLLQTGDVCFNTGLAETLEAISVSGAQAFYNGSVGEDLIRDIQRSGGILTMEDLQKYRVKITKPIAAETMMGLKILGMPPPSAGGAGMVLVLNILTQYGIPSGVSGSLGLHRLIESLKHMFAVRMNIGDPDFVDVSKVVADMLSPKFAEELKKKIYDNRTFDPGYYGGRWKQINDHGTSHISIVDNERNAVSMTSTVNAYFGAKIKSPSTGILLNNEMDDFSMPLNASGNDPPAPVNYISPSKRPLSSMSPTIVLKDEQLIGVMGASGGAMIPASTIEVFLNHFAKGMDPLSSIMAPRSYHELRPNVVQYENWTTVTGDHFEVPAETRADLQKKGHVLKALAGGTISQFIVHSLQKSKQIRGINIGNLTAVSDPRKGGFPAGY